jgi:Zn-dependent protease/CBS domain-containing protein
MQRAETALNRRTPDSAQGNARSKGASAKPRELVGPFGRKAIRLGRVFGIEVGLDWSWIFIFLLITFSLSQGFAQGSEEWTPVQSWTGALLASVLFFSSILLHEFGHGLTSNALGLPVRSITLFIFGGLARLSGEPKRPRDEFLIAAAGPAVSVVLGLGFLGVAALIPSEPVAANVLGVVCGWVGTINLVLAGFNLVPGFPLDGGRLLRSLVWRMTGSFERATVVAAATGSAFAYLLITAGILTALLGGALFNGLWFIFIGWFLLNAAQSSTLQVVLQRELGRLPLGPSAAPLEPVVSGDSTVADAIEKIILTHGARIFFVRDGAATAGMVTLHELKKVSVGDRDSTPVRAIMLAAPSLITVPYTASLWSALELMNEAGVSQLPVERDGQLVGLITRERLLRIIQNVKELDGPIGR